MKCETAPGCLYDEIDFSSLEQENKASKSHKAPIFRSKATSACLKIKESPQLEILSTNDIKDSNPLLQTLFKQGEDVCQSRISTDYLLGKEDKHYGIFVADRIFIFSSGYRVKGRRRSNLQRVICAYALTQEREFKNTLPARYVYLDVLCSRQNVGLGAMLLKQIFTYYQEYNQQERDVTKHFYFIEIRALPSIIPYYLKQGFEFGSPRFAQPYVLLQGETLEDGLHMFKLI